ncbi:membrane protein [sediment metagenome]|uniref:Membrane protein n=1 Tax=sediment metagenome TaxID=749907 RepID=D9PGW9_9ZZZZ
MILIFIGIFTFLSASLIFLKEPDYFVKIFILQIVAIILGFIFIYIIQKNKYINYLTIKNNSFFLFYFF